MKARLNSLGFDFTAKRQTLTLTVDGDYRNKYDELKDKDLEITIKPWRDHISKNANAYCWELLG